MGFLDDLFGGNSNNGSMPNYLKEKTGMSDNDFDGLKRDTSPRWVCPRCGTTNPGWYGKCKQCDNLKP